MAVKKELSDLILEWQERVDKFHFCCNKCMVNSKKYSVAWAQQEQLLWPDHWAAGDTSAGFLIPRNTLLTI